MDANAGARRHPLAELLGGLGLARARFKALGVAKARREGGVPDDPPADRALADRARAIVEMFLGIWPSKL
jgi:hypothetical protein